MPGKRSRGIGGFLVSGDLHMVLHFWRRGSGLMEEKAQVVSEGKKEGRSEGVA